MKRQISLKELAHFTERQLQATEAADKFRYTLFGGAAGPGKSYWLRWYSIRTLMKWGKELGLRGIRGALFSKDFPTLKDRQVGKMEVEFPRWLGEIRDSKTHGLGFHIDEKWGGHVLALRNLDDPSKYLSSEFALIAVEELTENKEEVFVRLRNRLRWTGIERTQFVAATNPGGIGHAWVKKLWIDKTFPIEEKEVHEFSYIKALPTDNPHLAKSYLMQLSSLPERLRKAYLDGNWDVFEGQYFTEWDIQKHVVQPFTLPKGWKLFRAYDHGREAPACCLWFALDPDGRVWCYRELYARGLNVDELAEKIKLLSGEEEYDYSVADPAIFANTGIVDRYGGQTIAEAFARRGIMFIPASNRRIDGWNLVHQYLSWKEESQPKLIFFSTCVESIRTIPALVHDAHRVEDLDTKSEDHSADTVRYFLASLHERVAPPLLNDTERKIAELKRRDESLDFNFYAPS